MAGVEIRDGLGQNQRGGHGLNHFGVAVHETSSCPSQFEIERLPCVMSSDWSWTEYGRGLAVDAARLWTDCRCGQFADMDNSWLRLRSWTGHNHGLTAGRTRTRTGCDHGLDQDKDAD